jgi:hypothetical protein
MSVQQHVGKQGGGGQRKGEHSDSKRGERIAVLCTVDVQQGETDAGTHD